MKQMIRNWKVIESLHDWILGNKRKKQIEIGVDLEVDGKIKVNDKESFTDKEGNPIDFSEETTIVDTEEIVHNETEEGIELYLAQTISNKIQNSMQLPADAPDTEKLVAIGTNGAQKLVDPLTEGKIYHHKLFVHQNVVSNILLIIDLFSYNSELINTVDLLYTALNSFNGPSKSIFSLHYDSSHELPTKIYLKGTMTAANNSISISIFEGTISSGSLTYAYKSVSKSNIISVYDEVKEL